MAAAGGDELEYEAGEGFGVHDGLVAQPQAYFVVAGLDVVEGEAADRGREVDQGENARYQPVRLSGRYQEGETGHLVALAGVAECWVQVGTPNDSDQRPAGCVCAPARPGVREACGLRS